MLFLGDLKIPTFGLKAMSGSDSWSYASHAVIEGKPKAQFIAPGARDVTLSIGLHVEFGAPQVFLDHAHALADAREVMTLQAESGLIFGDFVIQKIDWAPRALFPDGTPLSATATLTLGDPGLERPLEPRPRPMGVADEAEDIVTTPKVEDVSRPIGSVTPAEIARI